MDNDQIIAGKPYMNVTLALYKLFGLKITTVIIFKKACTVELSVCPKMGKFRCFTYVTVPYNVCKDIK